jgi:micrococcal nuclease
LNVHDGDTFTIPEGPVRVLGINTPEISGPAECYGQEATAAARDLLTDSMVILTPDPEQGDKDRYGRLLRYTTTDSGEDLAAYLLRYGYARVYEEYPVARTPEYREIQAKARAEMRGGWKDCSW